MTIELKAGTRLRSLADDTEVVVVRAPTTAVEISCGGHPMVDVKATATGREPDPAWMNGTLLGKRYGHAEVGLELLCVRPGIGSLAVDGVPMDAAKAKPLPASD